MVPYLRAELNHEFGLGPESVDADTTGEMVGIHYPSIQADHPYLTKRVLLEFGGRNLTEPHEARTIQAYAAEGLRGRLRLIPEGPLLRGLRADYEGMQDMIFGKALAFGTVLERLRLLETEINRTGV